MAPRGPSPRVGVAGSPRTCRGTSSLGTMPGSRGVCRIAATVAVRHQRSGAACTGSGAPGRSRRGWLRAPAGRAAQRPTSAPIFLDVRLPRAGIGRGSRADGCRGGAPAGRFGGVRELSSGSRLGVLEVDHRTPGRFVAVSSSRALRPGPRPRAGIRAFEEESSEIRRRSPPAPHRDASSCPYRSEQPGLVAEDRGRRVDGPTAPEGRSVSTTRERATDRLRWAIAQCAASLPTGGMSTPAIRFPGRRSGCGSARGEPGPSRRTASGAPPASAERPPARPSGASRGPHRWRPSASDAGRESPAPVRSARATLGATGLGCDRGADRAPCAERGAHRRVRTLVGIAVALPEPPGSADRPARGRRSVNPFPLGFPRPRDPRMLLSVLFACLFSATARAVVGRASFVLGSLGRSVAPPRRSFPVARFLSRAAATLADVRSTFSPSPSVAASSGPRVDAVGEPKPALDSDGPSPHRGSGAREEAGTVRARRDAEPTGRAVRGGEEERGVRSRGSTGPAAPTTGPPVPRPGVRDRFPAGRRHGIRRRARGIRVASRFPWLATAGGESGGSRGASPIGVARPDGGAVVPLRVKSRPCRVGAPSAPAGPETARGGSRGTARCLRPWTARLVVASLVDFPGPGERSKDVPAGTPVSAGQRVSLAPAATARCRWPDSPAPSSTVVAEIARHGGARRVRRAIRPTRPPSAADAASATNPSGLGRFERAVAFDHRSVAPEPYRLGLVVRCRRVPIRHGAGCRKYGMGVAPGGPASIERCSGAVVPDGGRRFARRRVGTAGGSRRVGRVGAGRTVGGKEHAREARRAGDGRLGSDGGSRRRLGREKRGASAPAREGAADGSRRAGRVGAGRTVGGKDDPGGRSVPAPAPPSRGRRGGARPGRRGRAPRDLARAPSPGSTVPRSDSPARGARGSRTSAAARARPRGVGGAADGRPISGRT